MRTVHSTPDAFTQTLIADLRAGMEVYDGHRFIGIRQIRAAFMDTEEAQRLFLRYCSSPTEQEREEQNTLFEQQLDTFLCNTAKAIAPNVMEAEAKLLMEMH